MDGELGVRQTIFIGNFGVAVIDAQFGERVPEEEEQLILAAIGKLPIAPRNEETSKVLTATLLEWANEARKRQAIRLSSIK